MQKNIRIGSGARTRKKSSMRGEGAEQKRRHAKARKSNDKNEYYDGGI